MISTDLNLNFFLRLRESFFLLHSNINRKLNGYFSIFPDKFSKIHTNQKTWTVRKGNDRVHTLDGISGESMSAESPIYFLILSKLN